MTARCRMGRERKGFMSMLRLLGMRKCEMRFGVRPVDSRFEIRIYEPEVNQEKLI